jgi:hypothetical protein
MNTEQLPKVEISIEPFFVEYATCFYKGKYRPKVERETGEERIFNITWRLLVKEKGGARHHE